MLPYVAEANKMSLLAQLPHFGAWSPCAPACSCVVCPIRACFHVFSLILAVFTTASASLGTNLDIIPIELRLFTLEMENLPCS